MKPTTQEIQKKLSKHLLYSKRKRLAESFERWRAENPGVANCPENVITFLHGNDLLDIKAVNEFLKKGGEE